MPSNRFRTYIDEEDEEQIFTVFVVHGHSPEVLKLKDFIQNRLQFQVVVLADEFRGKVILQKLEDAIEEQCDCVVAIMSPDDRTVDNRVLARQNVIYEIGYCRAFFRWSYGDELESEPVIILKEETVEVPSDIHGIEYISYKGGNLEAKFHDIGTALMKVFEELTEEEEEGIF